MFPTFASTEVKGNAASGRETMMSVAELSTKLAATRTELELALAEIARLTRHGARFQRTARPHAATAALGRAGSGRGQSGGGGGARGRAEQRALRSNVSEADAEALVGYPVEDRLSGEAVPGSVIVRDVEGEQESQAAPLEQVRVVVRASCGTASCAEPDRHSRRPAQVSVRYLVATMGRRDHFIDHNRRRHPGLVLEPFRSTNGMNTSEARAAAAPKTRLRAARSSLTLRPKAHVQVHHFFAAHPALRLYKLFTWTYGMLASWTTKYRALEDQARERA